MNKKTMRASAFATALLVTASSLSLSVYAAPAKYSSVDEDYVTSVKNQGNWGVCWAFSSTALSETALIKKFPDKFNAATLDLSENLLAYMVSHPSLYGQINASGDTAAYTQSATYYLQAGGNSWNAALSIMNGFGVYDENAEYPYDVYGTPSIANKSFTESEYYALKNSGTVKMNGLFVADVNQNNDNDALKELILKYGAASISYCETYTDFNVGDDGSYYYYCPTEQTANHTVTVVGWDDSIPASSFKTAPAGNGAWLIKNSWGKDSRDDGYFWLSYYDKSIHTAGTAYDYTVSGADDYFDTLYNYDGGNSASSFGYGRSVMYGANVFTAEADSYITGAAVYTAKGTDIELSLYTNLKNKTNPTSGTKAAVISKENVAYDGYYSLQFDTAVNVKQGDTFTIVAKITNSNGSVRIYGEYGYSMNGLTYSLKANKGESYFTYDPDLFWNDCVDSNMKNLMIKAYAVADNKEECTEHDFEDWSVVTPATCTTVGEKHRVCKACRFEETAEISALGHTYSDEWTTDVQASCKAVGSKSHHCIRCDAKTDVTVIPVANHTVTVDKAIAATCTETGLTEGSHCSVCGKIIEEQAVVPAKGHQYTETVVAPTYTSTGYTLYKCSVCGYSYKDNETAKLTLSKVTNFKIKSISSTNVTLQWTKNSAASGYEIEQYKDGKWVNVAKITSNATTSYTVKGLSAGTAGYKFRMRAVKDDVYSEYTSTLTVNTNPYGVGGFKTKSISSTSVMLQWNKGTTASGYQLQQYKDGKWVTIYTGTKATDTSYTVKNLKDGTAGYRFRIRAYKTYGSTKQYGSWSSEVKVNTNPYGVGGFKTKSISSTSITLQWNKGTTASGYQLQQYKDGKWVTIYTGTKATDTSYTVKNLKAGTAGYRFRIRAYKTYGSSKQYGSWSSEVKVNTNPYGVGGFKAKSTAKTSITLGWNKGTTASGYQLQQYKNGKWVTVYTGTKATSTSYTVKSLKANTSYKFRIRAYKTYGSTKQYGSWSSTLTVKTSK